MNYLDKRTIQLLEVNILVKFHDFCVNNNLKYSLVAGSLLGAVRHKGFIPWDDDIDVGMPRRDYEKLKMLKIKFNDERYNLLSDDDGPYPFSKIYDTRISIDSKASTDKFLWIDVFPLDGVPQNNLMALSRFIKASIVRRMYTVLDSSWQKDTFSARKVFKYLLCVPAKIMGKEKCKKILIKNAKKSEYDNSFYIGAVVWGIHGLGERIPREEFEKSVELDFEDHKFLAMKCWDLVLKNIYGNYMELPPEEKRVCHTMTAYDNTTN